VVKLRILFIDDRIDEVMRQWELSGCEKDHIRLPMETFNSLERTLQIVKSFKPDVILVGYWFGKDNVTGGDVIQFLRQNNYNGYVIANSGGGIELFNHVQVKVDGSANRKPQTLKMIMDNLTKRRESR